MLWAFTTIVNLLMGISMIFFPGWVNSGPPATNTETVIIGAIIFVPQIIFLIYIGNKNLKG